jgi:hypothetical protein
LNKSMRLTFFIMISLILMQACQSQPVKTPLAEETRQNQPAKNIKESSISSKTFKENVDWISDSEVLTVKENEGKTALYITDVYTGESEKVYDIPLSYVHSMVSPDRDKILIHSAPATYTAKITIIDLNGKELYNGEIPSYELSYEWNEFDTNKLLITSFAEDWSFDVFELDLKDPELQKVDVQQPFLKWNSDVSVLYQDWDNDRLSVSAPLVSKNLLDAKKETIDSSSIHFERFPGFLLSVHSDEEAEPAFSYQFINDSGEVLSQFETHLLSRYSDWFIPYYDMIDKKDELITFQADNAGSFDTYTGAFSMKRWDVPEGSAETLFENLPLEPIQCSPQGLYCLYGNQLEKVIDLKNPAIIRLLKEEG